MKYDEEYGSYKFNTRDMELILDALSYAHCNDNSLSHSDSDYIDGLYQSFDNSGVNQRMAF